MFPPFNDKGVVFGQGRFGQTDLIEFFLLEPDRRMMDLGSHLLVKDIFDVMGPIGVMQGGPLNGLDQGIGAVFVLEIEKFVDILLERLMSGRQTFQIGLGLFPETDKGLHLSGLPHPPFLSESRFPVDGQLDPFPVFIGAWMSGDNLIPEIDGQGMMVRLDNDLFADGPGRHGIGIGVKAD